MVLIKSMNYSGIVPIDKRGMMYRKEKSKQRSDQQFEQQFALYSR
ncbi:hypothetical protein OQJ42_04110 [Enterococcus faecium]|nr:hypothetical protein [Enterococcus faecium]MCW8793716.1 hypothetical protein [Enterococcus faecium]